MAHTLLSLRGKEKSTANDSTQKEDDIYLGFQKKYKSEFSFIMNIMPILKCFLNAVG